MSNEAFEYGGLSPQGVVVAHDIYDRFKKGEALEEIGKDHNLSVEEIQVLMHLAEDARLFDHFDKFSHAVWQNNLKEAQSLFDAAADAEGIDDARHRELHAAGSVLELVLKSGYKPDDHIQTWLESLYDDIV